MSQRLHPLAAALAATLALAACQKPAAAPAQGTTTTTTTSTTSGKEGDASKPAADAIPGLPTERDQVSYTLGMAMGKQLKDAKGEVDIDTIAKGMRAVINGDKPLLTDDQGRKIMEAFAQKMQAKQMADQMAQQKKNGEEGDKFLAENGKKPDVKTTASGLQYQVITQGTGPKPKPTDLVKVNYKGTLLDGKEFDSTAAHGGEPAVMPVNRVIPGWSEGVQLMPVGSKYRFWIPAKLAYGETGTPGGPIPPNATLAFEVELLEIAKAPPAGPGAGAGPKGK